MPGVFGDPFHQERSSGATLAEALESSTGKE